MCLEILECIAIHCLSITCTFSLLFYSQADSYTTIYLHNKWHSDWYVWVHATPAYPINTAKTNFQSERKAQILLESHANWLLAQWSHVLTQVSSRAAIMLKTTCLWQMRRFTSPAGRWGGCAWTRGGHASPECWSAALVCPPESASAGPRSPVKDSTPPVSRTEPCISSAKRRRTRDLNLRCYRIQEHLRISNASIIHRRFNYPQLTLTTRSGMFSIPHHECVLACRIIYNFLVSDFVHFSSSAPFLCSTSCWPPIIQAPHFRARQMQERGSESLLNIILAIQLQSTQADCEVWICEALDLASLNPSNMGFCTCTTLLKLWGSVLSSKGYDPHSMR